MARQQKRSSNVSTKEYGKSKYERLAGISVAHLYRLRQSRRYREQRMDFTKTKPTNISIGERRCPEPGGKPGYLRLDTVHQGDLDGTKGVYHLNAVDKVTQWELLQCVPRINELYVQPAIAALPRLFPFRLHGVHTDNGSEFINHSTESLMKLLLIEQTKSRPRRSNDNGLVEAKNGAVVRKHMGYLHIGAEHAPKVQEFYDNHLNDYLNFHRPCGQVQIVTDSKGKQRCEYPSYLTPWEVFSRLPDASQYLRAGLTMAELNRIAESESDTDSARRMQEAKRKLFAGFQLANRSR